MRIPMRLPALVAILVAPGLVGCGDGGVSPVGLVTGFAKVKECPGHPSCDAGPGPEEDTYEVTVTIGNKISTFPGRSSGDGIQEDLPDDDLHIDITDVPIPNGCTVPDGSSTGLFSLFDLRDGLSIEYYSIEIDGERAGYDLVLGPGFSATWDDPDLEIPHTGDPAGSNTARGTTLKINRKGRRGGCVADIVAVAWSVEVTLNTGS